MTRLSANDGTKATESGEPSLVPVLTGYRRAEYLLGAGVWAAALFYFWVWWLEPRHHVDTLGSIMVTAVLAWVTLLPAYFIAVFYRAAKPNGPLRLPAGSRVAMVVTKAPSEPFSIVSETLKAMLAQDVPHDTWLADEDPSEETLAWCRRYGVFVSTRKGRADYHRTSWPRRTRCKEGNLAFFYDHYGYERYDLVAQLDADHVPEPGYLFEMLRPFADPRVGYVSAPSICDRNGSESWAARGRLHAEASMHGSLQAGYNGGLAPLCIGSHYAVRTAALEEIGGLGPELAEDHSTTLMMNAAGWRGVHALDAIAHGDGPRTFGDLVTQEFQWSRSLVMLLLQYSPRLVGRLPLRLKFQFLFSQLWYPLFALFMAIMFAMPIIALARSETFVAVTYPDFLAHFTPLSIILVLLAYRWRASGTFRPYDAKILSWECMLFLFARWPWALAGTLAAMRDWVTGSFVDFRVTPKGASEVDPLPLRVLTPYALLAVTSVLPVFLVSDAAAAKGLYIFAILNAAIYCLLLLVIVARHSKENAVVATSRFRRPAMAASLLALVALPGIATAEHGKDGLEALAWGAGHLRLFEERYAVAGAGQDGTALRKIVFRPRWISVTAEQGPGGAR
ncbi:glycosyltransferase family 2 protein [Sinorhizobium terangae]|uniref:Glycosyltransferase n=1 Tax=Sinorhizobium terangae TaxID=110322 RepID=A0A6N7LBN5_SINTE|nr:glycosyltransferase family 2 protein [Sinorhizobium terangae]MBB4188582.1 cellulose synthase/poly-beta-1,6-N-acetylglucosamine synthase-like glycosyltransferase [Sinorhizobium terangae]MQX14609.1 glycosyltransferase [Sinorhizobium terangae]WFU49804.1 glycosyltransferase [Sinorhizobium terangae]